MSKKLWTVLFSVLLAFAFAACGDDDKPGDNNSSVTSSGSSDGPNPDGSVLAAKGDVLITYVFTGNATWWNTHNFTSQKFIQLHNVSTKKIDLRNVSLQMYYGATYAEASNKVVLGPEDPTVTLTEGEVTFENDAPAYTGVLEPGKSLLIGVAKSTIFPDTSPADSEIPYKKDATTILPDIASTRLGVSWGGQGTGIILVNGTNNFSPAGGTTPIDDPRVIDAFGWNSGGRIPNYYFGSFVNTAAAIPENSFGQGEARFSRLIVDGAYKNTPDNAADFFIVPIEARGETALAAASRILPRNLLSDALSASDNTDATIQPARTYMTIFVCSGTGPGDCDNPLHTNGTQDDCNCIHCAVDPSPGNPIPAFVNHDFEESGTFVGGAALTGTISTADKNGGLSSLLIENIENISGNQLVVIGATDKLYPRFNRTKLSFWVKGTTQKTGVSNIGAGTTPLLMFTTGGTVGNTNPALVMSAGAGTLSAPVVPSGNANSTVVNADRPILNLTTWTQYFVTVPTAVPAASLAISIRIGGNSTNGVESGGIEMYVDDFMWVL